MNCESPRTTSVLVITRPTLAPCPVRGMVMPFSSAWLRTDIRRLAVRHPPLDGALVEIDRREHAVRRLQDRQPLHGQSAAAFAPAATAAAPVPAPERPAPPARFRGLRRRRRRAAPRRRPACPRPACPPRPRCGTHRHRCRCRPLPQPELLSDDPVLVGEIGESRRWRRDRLGRHRRRVRVDEHGAAFPDRSRRPASWCRR